MAVVARRLEDTFAHLARQRHADPAKPRLQVGISRAHRGQVVLGHAPGSNQQVKPLGHPPHIGQDKVQRPAFGDVGGGDHRAGSVVQIERLQHQPEAQ